MGGVLTGKWKAMLQARPAGKIKYNGCISMASDCKQKQTKVKIIELLSCRTKQLTISAKTGTIILAIATFELKAVKMTATIIIMKSSTKCGSDFNPTNALPINEAIPLTLLPSAKAKPPPNKKTRPHGTLPCMNFQVINEGVVEVGTGPVSY